MTKAEKIEQLIGLEHPLEQAVAEIVEGVKRDFFQLEEGAISKENQARAATEIEQALRGLKDMRHDRLVAIYDGFTEGELDALLTLHSSADKLKAAMTDAHELKWDWVNGAKEMSPTMNDIIVHAGVNWMVNNTEGEVADSIATQPLEDLGATAPATPPAPPADPPTAA